MFAPSLDKLEESVKQGKNLVVALGDKKYAFTQIKELNYLEDYLFEKNEISNKLAIEFIIDAKNTIRLPFSKIISSCNFRDLNLQQKALTRLNQRIERHGNLDNIINSITLDKANAERIFTTITEIKNAGFSKRKEPVVVIKNIRHIDVRELSVYVKEDIFLQFISCDNENLKTVYRKLFLAYDLLINGDIKKPL